jgi:hypothetical protein
MKSLFHPWFWISIFFFCFQFSCIKTYNPLVQNAPNAYLVVDGMINTQGFTTINLSRTQNISSIKNPPAEAGASLSIVDQNGTIYPLKSAQAAGAYTSDSLNLSSSGQYRIQIQTLNGEKYQSDWLKPKNSPPVDSLNWKRNNGVQIYVNSHDPSGLTQYYRWQYIITYEYHSELVSYWGLSNGYIYPYPLGAENYICYPVIKSNKILVANSLALKQDLISQQLIASIPDNDSILNYRISIQVLQYALNPQSYTYWNLIKNNSQSLGTLFDLQPSQLTGNIHCLTNPAEPVIGYLSAGTLSTSRIFINNSSLPHWQSDPSNYNCMVQTITTTPGNTYLYTYPDTSYAPYYFVSAGSAPPFLKIAKKPCVDCRIYGQTNVKPSFW